MNNISTAKPSRWTAIGAYSDKDDLLLQQAFHHCAAAVDGAVANVVRAAHGTDPRHAYDPACHNLAVGAALTAYRTALIHTGNIDSDLSHLIRFILSSDESEALEIPSGSALKADVLQFLNTGKGRLGGIFDQAWITAPALSPEHAMLACRHMDAAFGRLRMMQRNVRLNQRLALQFAIDGVRSNVLGYISHIQALTIGADCYHEQGWLSE